MQSNEVNIMKNATLAVLFLEMYLTIPIRNAY